MVYELKTSIIVFLRSTTCTSASTTVPCYGYFVVLTKVPVTNFNQDISDGTFDGLIAQSLEELYIYNSWLTRVPPSLKALTALKVLSIEKSRINFMPSGIFDGMSALVDLKISRGSVTDVGETTFSGLKNLKRLSLDNNLIG